MLAAMRQITMLSCELGKKKDDSYPWTENQHVTTLLRELEFIIYYRKWTFSVDCQQHLLAGSKALVLGSLDNSPLRVHSRWSCQAVTDRDVTDRDELQHCVQPLEEFCRCTEQQLRV